MPRALSHLFHHSHAATSHAENVVPIGGQIARFELEVAAKNDGHRNFLTKCAGWCDGRVSVDLTPQFWSKLQSAKTTDIEQSFTDATLLTSRHSSAAASTVELLAESDSVGDLTGADLVKIANEQKAAREYLRSFQEPTCYSVRGIPNSDLKEYAKISGDSDMKKDYEVYKESQMFREHLVKIANISDPTQRNLALKKELYSHPHFLAESIIALYRLG